MPTVPTYDTPQVLPQGGAAPYRQPAAVDNEYAARQLGAAGDALQRVGVTLTEEEARASALAGQVRVDAGLNEAIQEKQRLTLDPADGYANKKGAAALDPDPLGRSLAQRYTEDLQAKISTISQGLGNDEQRRVFNQQAAGLVTQFSGDVQRHMLQEHRAFGLGTQEGAIKLAADEAKLHWDDPDRIGEQIKSAEAAVWKAGQINGEPANLIQAKMKDTTSAIHTGAIAAALQNDNPTYAQQYLERFRSAMTADDILRTTGLVNHGVDSRVSLDAVRSATAKMSSQIQPTDLDRLTSIVMGLESSGKTNAVGPYIKDQGTAKGSMQVMDATKVDPGYGVTPAKDNSPEERARVGRDYLAAMVKQYGNPAQAMAAYNAGPATVDKAITAAKKNGTTWMAEMANFQSPENFKQTQAYVISGMNKLQAGGGAAPFPTESAFVQSALDGLGPNPRIEQVKMTREQAVAQYTMLDKSRREQGDQAVQRAQRELVQNGGSFAVLDPQTRADVMRFAPDKYDDLQAYAGKIADPVRSDNLEAYNQAKTHPEALAQLSETDFESFIKQNFTQRTAREIVNTRNDYLTGKEDLSAQAINRPAVTRALNAQLDALRIPTTHSLKDAAANERLGGIRLFVDQSILDAQRASGQKMTPDQVNTHIAKLFTTDVTFKNTLWYGGKGPDTSQKLMAMQLGDLPAGAAEGLTKSLVAAGNKSPTATDILNLYRKMHVR